MLRLRNCQLERLQLALAFFSRSMDTSATLAQRAQLILFRGQQALGFGKMRIGIMNLALLLCVFGFRGRDISLVALRSRSRVPRRVRG